MLTVTDIFAGAGGSTKRERVRLAGNAVTPPAARDLITVLAESLGVAA